MININKLITILTVCYYVLSFYKYQKLKNFIQNDSDITNGIENYFCILFIVWFYLTIPLYILLSGIEIIYDLINNQ